jgi:tripartite-type tricarboxylate transporter receptor subunit TctC
VKLFKNLFFFVGIFCVQISAWSQTFPSQPIKLIMPFLPGTASENAVRLVMDRLSQSLKQPIVLDNRPGAGSTLGTDQAAKSAPNGYTLLASYNSSIAPGTLLYNKLGYDPVKDFKHIALIGVFPQFMLVRADHPAKTLKDFIAMVRAKPGAVNYSSAGVGTSGFLAAEMLKQALNLDMVHVPYKGSAPAIADLLGGRLDAVFTSSAAALVSSGNVRVLAVTSDKRLPAYPDVPALSEIAPKVQAVSWVGISAPAQTPAAITQLLEKEILTILQSPEMRNKLSDPALGMTLTPLGSDRFLGFIQSEINLWSPVIKAANISLNQ